MDSSLSSNIDEIESSVSIDHNPVIVEKFELLVSTLKDVQNNIQEIDSLITSQNICEKKTFPEDKHALDSSEPTPVKNLGVCIDASKTDEAKLNEILGLLHNITGALSSYEQLPLLSGNQLNKIEPRNGEDNNLSDSFNLSETSQHFHKEEQQQKSNLETKSLRFEIDSAIRRKDALDERLRQFIYQRQNGLDEDNLLSSAVDQTENTLHDSGLSQSPHRRPEELKSVKIKKAKKKSRLKDKKYNSNDDQIEELRHDEEQVLGLNESGLGLSKEINSLNTNIQEIIKENQQYQAFFQGLSTDASNDSKNIPSDKIQKNPKPMTEYQEREVINQEVAKAFLGNGRADRRSANASPTFHDEIMFSDVGTTSDTEHLNTGTVDFKKLSKTHPEIVSSINYYFESKMKSLVESQENSVELLIKEKELSDIKCDKLEKMVENLIALNEENQKKYQNEIHSLDAENCRLQDQIDALDSINQSTPQPQDSIDNNSVQLTVQSRNYHSVCQAHIEKLSNEKEFLQERLIELGEDELKRQESASQKPRHHTSTASLPSSQMHNQSKFNPRGMTFAKTPPSVHEVKEKYNSLPIFPQRRDLLSAASNDIDADVSQRQTCEPSQTESLDEQLSLLKSRVKYLESYLTQQYSDSKSSKEDSHDHRPSSNVQATATSPRQGDILDDTFSDRELSEELPPLQCGRKNKSSSISEREKAVFYQKIVFLMEEKECLSKRLEEVMKVTRELAFLFKNAKEELMSIKSQRSDVATSISSEASHSEDASSSFLPSSTSQESRSSALQEHSNTTNLLIQRQRPLVSRNEVDLIPVKDSPRSLESATSTKDSKTSHRSDSSEGRKCKRKVSKQQSASAKDDLVISLQQRIQALQFEVEKAWRESHEKGLLYEKMKIEKEHLNHFLTSNLSSVEEENQRLQQTLQAVRHENKTLCLELQSLKHFESQNAHSSDKLDSWNLKLKKGDEGDESWKESINNLEQLLIEEKTRNQSLVDSEAKKQSEILSLTSQMKSQDENLQTLQAKYKKLRHFFTTKKSEKRGNKELFKEYSEKMEEFNSTTAAIEGNYKVMLSTLGHNIGIAVELLSSHLYFSPAQIHPSPELSKDPAFWFAAQCSRLRWLQAQLRKLCVHTWKLAPHFDGQKSNTMSKLGGSRSFELGNLNTERKISDLGEGNSTKTTSSSSNRQSFEDKLNLCSLQTITQDSNIWSSLSDAELNITKKQTELHKNKNSQLNTLVNIFKSDVTTKEVSTDIKTVKNSSVGSIGIATVIEPGDNEFTQPMDNDDDDDNSTLKNSDDEISKTDLPGNLLSPGVVADSNSAEKETVIKSTEVPVADSTDSHMSTLRDSENVNFSYQTMKQTKKESDLESSEKTSELDEKLKLNLSQIKSKETSLPEEEGSSDKALPKSCKKESTVEAEVHWEPTEEDSDLNSDVEILSIDSDTSFQLYDNSLSGLTDSKSSTASENRISMRPTVV